MTRTSERFHGGARRERRETLDWLAKFLCGLCVLRGENPAFLGVVVLLSCAASVGAQPGRAGIESGQEPLPAGVLARLGSTRLQHTACISKLSFSPDGRQLAAVSEDGVLCLWDLRDGRRVLQHAVDYKAVLAFGADGQQLALTDHTGVIRLWRTTDGAVTGRIERPKTLHDYSVRALHVHEDGPRVTVLDNDAVFHAGGAGYTQRRFLPTEGQRFRALSADGRWAIAEDEHHAFAIWDVSTAEQRLRFPCRCELIYWAAFTPDSRLALVSRVHGGTEVWELATAQLVRTLPAEGNLHGFTADGRKLALAPYWETTIRIWDLATGRRERVIDQGTPITALAYSPDGRLIATGDDHGTLRLWHAATGQPVEARERLAGIRPLHFSPDARTLLVRSDLGLHHFALDARPARGAWQLREERRHNIPELVTAAPDGKTAVTESRLMTFLWDIATANERCKLGPAERRRLRVAYAPDGRTMAILTRYDFSLRDAGTGKILDDLTEKSADGNEPPTPASAMRQAHAAMFSPDGKTLVLAVADKQLVIWERTKRKSTIWEIPAADESDHGELDVAIDPDGRRVALTSSKRGFWVVDKQSGRVLFASQDRTKELDLPVPVSFSPDGRLLATMGHDETRIQLWEVASGKPFTELVGHIGAVKSLVFSPDSRVLASSAADNTLLLWDLRLTSLATPAANPTAAQLWQRLADADAVELRRALATLTADPAGGVACLRQHLRPIAPVPPQRLRTLITDLDADNFPQRQTAFAELKALGIQAADAVRRALDKPASLEAKRRLEQLVTGLPDGVAPLPPGDLLRNLRAIWALEQMGTAPARALLAELADGDPQASESQAARAALARLGTRASFSGGS